MDKEKIRKGIEYYKHEQDALLRLIRMKGGLSTAEFDELYSYRGVRKKRFMLKSCGITGDTFILGGMMQTTRDVMLDLLQHMMALTWLIPNETKTGNSQ